MHIRMAPKIWEPRDKHSAGSLPPARSVEKTAWVRGWLHHHNIPGSFLAGTGDPEPSCDNLVIRWSRSGGLLLWAGCLQFGVDDLSLRTTALYNCSSVLPASNALRSYGLSCNSHAKLKPGQTRKHCCGNIMLPTLPRLPTTGNIVASCKAKMFPSNSETFLYGNNVS